MGATLFLPVAFSTMALLRLFVLFPTAWEGIGNATVSLANTAAMMTPFPDWFGEERAKSVRTKVFNMYEGEQREVSDMKDSAVKYLLVEFVLESLPQIIIQSVNNTAVGWSPVAIASMVVSGYAILNTIYKYGWLWCSKTFDGDDETYERRKVSKFENPVYSSSSLKRNNKYMPK